MQTHETNTGKVISAGFGWLLDAASSVAVLPYGQVYRRNTRLPIVTIIGKDDEGEIHSELLKWFKVKLREAQYVQVAGAILFSSIVSCLSWNNIEERHWSGPALWYAGIIFALISVVLGAQQTMIMPEASDTIDSLTMKRRLMASETLNPQPNRLMLFVWQSPLMCLTYSIICFLGGLTSVVVSPLVQDPRWSNDAKTVLIFLIAAVLASFIYVGTGVGVHSLVKR